MQKRSVKLYIVIYVISLLLFHCGIKNPVDGDYNELGFNNAKINNNTFGIYVHLTYRAKYLYEEGKYDEALKTYQEILAYRKQQKDPLEIFWGYYEFFN